MNYKTLTSDERAQAVRERLRTMEAQHFALGLRLETSLPGGDPEEDGIMYDQLGRHIRELHNKLTELEGGTSGGQ